ncbi:MAG: HD domain-containing protein [Lachnospiraceae bacterium]|jgi:putative nucleotidyltransferase with HDIG domain|nr:HD domain-containing protein [Lachnospiraceae bacterium]
MGLKLLMLHNVTKGMKIAEDVYKGSQLIVKKNKEVTQEVLDVLHFSDIISVTVYDGKDDEPAPAPAKPEPAKSSGPSHSERLRQTETFKKFEEAFQETTENFKVALNDIARNQDAVPVDDLFESANNIMEHATNTYQLMDILSNIRYFDDSTYAHSLNVALLANILGRWLHFDEEELKKITVAGMLHDIGKVVLPKSIIQKPSALTEEEFQIVKSHPMEGYKILMSKNVDEEMASAALFHHEKCDGSGYPNGFTGDQITDIAKIIAIIDVYEAMTADRVYRDGICPFKVIRIFEDEGYAKYDPKYMLPFLRGIADTYLHNNVLLSDGREGEIILTNTTTPSKPSLIVNGQFVDLSKTPGLTIDKIL